MQLLLDHGADIEAVNYDGLTAVMVAKGADTTKLLLSKKADLSARKAKDKRTGLHAAAMRNNMVLAQTLVTSSKNSRGFDIDEPDSLGQTALHLAAMTDSLEVAQFLCDNGADVELKNKKGRPPILVTKNMNMMRVLINNGSDPTVNSHDTGSGTLYNHQYKTFLRFDVSVSFVTCSTSYHLGQ